MIEGKPPHGEPCNGCGACCAAALCELAAAVFPSVNPESECPALMHDGERYRCGLVADPLRFAPVRTAIHGAENMSAAAMLLTASGLGCDAQVSEEPENVAFLERMNDYRTRARPLILPALALWSP